MKKTTACALAGGNYSPEKTIDVCNIEWYARPTVCCYPLMHHICVVWLKSGEGRQISKYYTFPLLDWYLL